MLGKLGMPSSDMDRRLPLVTIRIVTRPLLGAGVLGSLFRVWKRDKGSKDVLRVLWTPGLGDSLRLVVLLGASVKSLEEGGPSDELRVLCTPLFGASSSDFLPSLFNSSLMSRNSGPQEALRCLSTPLVG
jgi:hypothetical protein